MDNLFDLAATISVQHEGVDRALTQTQQKVLSLAQEFKKTEASAQSSGAKMALSMAAVNAELGKMRTGNYAADIDKFQNALRNNSVTARKAADDFLALFGNTNRHATATRVAEGESRKLSEALRIVASSAVIAEGPLGGVSSRLRAMASESTQLSAALGPEGIIVAGLLAAAAAAAALSIGMFELSKHTAEYAEKMDKAQITTGLSQRALAGLKVLSDETGSSFDGLITSAARLQTAISRGISEPAGEAGRALKFLGLQNEAFKQTAPDKQLQMVAKALSEVTNQADKNRASQALMNRGWIESAESIRRIAEGFDAAQKKADEFGLVMTEEDIKAAREFNIAVNDLWLRFEGFGLAVGREILPQVEGALKDLTAAIFGASGALGTGESAWAAWAAFARDSIASVRVAWSFVANLGSPMGLYGAWAAANETGDRVVSQMRANNMGGTATLGAGLTRQRGFPGGGRGGGGGDPASAAKRLADLRLKGVIDELKFEEDANKRSLDRQWQDFNQYAGKYNEIELRRHHAVVDGLQIEMNAAERVRKPQERAVAIQEIRNKQAQEENTHTKNSNAVLDARAKLLDQVNDFIDQQTREIGYARTGADQYEKAISELEVQLRKAGFSELAFKLELARTNAETQRAIDLAKSLTRERRAIAERPRVVEDDNFWRLHGIELSRGDETRPRRTTDALRERMRDLACDLTDSIDRAIYEGFRGGVKKGIASLLTSLLDMIRNVLLKQLEAQLTAALMSIKIGEGGGGWLSKILGWTIGAAGGAIGGVIPIGGGGHGGGTIGTGGKGIPGHAAGLNFVPYDNYLALLHKGERVVPASQNHGNVTIQVFAQDVKSFMNRDTQAQISRAYRNVLMKPALVG